MKIHTVDWKADAWLAGTSKLGPTEGWLYITIINLIYSHGEAIEADKAWLGRVANMHGRAVKNALEKLIALGKVQVGSDGKLMANHCQSALQSARKRVVTASQNGAKGGRPSKDINGIGKPAGLPYARANHQPPTTTLSEPKGSSRDISGIDDKSKRSRWPADREVPMEWVGETYRLRHEVDGYEAMEEFQAYWSTGKGHATARTEPGWKQTWVNWIKRCRPGKTGWVDRYGYDRHLHQRMGEA